MGFAHMLDFKKDGIPSKLGFYVVNNFNPTNMELKLSSTSLQITKESIGDMLGLKNEGFDIMAKEKANNAELLSNWKAQFEEGKTFYAWYYEVCD